MIHEQPAAKIETMVQVMNGLLFAYDYFKEQAVFYRASYLQVASQTQEGVKLPDSPLAALYQDLCNDALNNMFSCHEHMEQLEGISNTIHQPGRDY